MAIVAIADRDLCYGVLVLLLVLIIAGVKKIIETAGG
jgi:hypothetical protein